MSQMIEISSFDESIDYKLVIDWISKSFSFDENHESCQPFVRRLLALNSNSVGIKYSDPPFNVNKKFTQKYIKELLNLAENSIESQSTDGLTQLGAKVLHVFIESAHNLKDKKINECNPFFKVYLKTYCRDDRLLSTSKPFVSDPLKNTANPKWNTRLDIEIPDSVSPDKSLEKTYRQEICIELWSRNFFTCYERLTKICSKTDQYLGSVYLKIGKRSSNENFFTYCIPSTATSQRLALSNDSVGSLTMRLIWGRKSVKGEHQMFINHHILLYTLSFKWHLNELKSEKNRKLFQELKVKEELTHSTFFYMPAVSLHNQHRIQSNLTLYEDSIIRRSVLLKLIEHYSSQNKIFSTILAKLLANEAITRKSYMAWLSKAYVQTLNQIEMEFVRQLCRYIESNISLLTAEMIERSESVQLLFFCLKALRKYHRKYRDLNLKTTINKLIGESIADWIGKNIQETEKWPQIITFLTYASEKLRKYWYKLQSIIDSKTSQIITSVNDLKFKAKELIENWKINKKDSDLSHKILNYFLFITEFNEFFQMNSRVTSSSDHNYTDTLTYITEAKEVPEEDIKPLEKFLKQIRTEESKKLKPIEIKLTDLRYSQFLRPEETDNGFWKDFGKEIFDHWIEERIESLYRMADEMVPNFVKAILREQKINALKSRRMATKFFFNALSQLVYFSLAIAAKHYWNYENCRSVLRQLCEICFRFCDSLKSYCLEYSSTFDENKDKEKVLFLALICWNTLDVMQKIHFKTDLIELLTDIKAPLIHKLIKDFQSVDKKLDEYNSSDKRTTKIFKICEHIMSVSNEIEGLQKDITQDLSHKIVKHLYEDINELIKIFPNKPNFETKYQTIEKTLKQKIEIISDNMSEKQTICDIILIVKTRGETIFLNQCQYIFKFFKTIETEDKKNLYLKMTQMFDLFKELVTKYHCFQELMTNFASDLSVIEISIIKDKNVTQNEEIIKMLEYFEKKTKRMSEKGLE